MTETSEPASDPDPPRPRSPGLDGREEGGARARLEALESGRLYTAAADAVVDVVGQAIEAHGGARWVLAGGGTPTGLYREIVRRHGGSVDWSRVDFYWGDERMVPPDQEASNYQGALASLLTPLAIERRRIHRIRGELGAENAARRYDLVASEVLTNGAWDLVLLGLGADGHTASLFPPMGAAARTRAWALPTVAPSSPHARVSLSLRALNRSRHVFFLATGAEKAAAAARVLGGDEALPATHVTSLGGDVRWFLDLAAAAVRAARVQSDATRGEET